MANETQKTAYQQNVSTLLQQQKQITAREIMGDIYQMAQYNPAQAQEQLNRFMAARQDSRSQWYDPYSKPTNQAASSFANYGIDIGTIDDDWFEKNRGFMTSNLIYDGTSTTPTKPGKKATQDQQLAYDMYQWWKSEDTTKKAEQEWQALQEELSYWAKDTSRNYSDQEILNKIDWSKYKTLSSMNENKYTAPTELNRGIDFSEDAMYGILWSARNPDYDGDLYGAMANSALGTGNQWIENPVISAKLNKNDLNTYSPYSVGMTLEEEGLYFGAFSFDQDAIDEIRDNLNFNDVTAVKMFQNLQKAEDNTVKAEEELEKLTEKVDGWINSGFSEDRIKKKIDAFLDDCPTLRAMDKSLRSTDLLPTTRAIDYKYEDLLSYVSDRLHEKYAVQIGMASAMETMSRIANEFADDPVKVLANYFRNNGQDVPDLDIVKAQDAVVREAIAVAEDDWSPNENAHMAHAGSVAWTWMKGLWGDARKALNAVGKLGEKQAIMQADAANKAYADASFAAGQTIYDFENVQKKYETLSQKYGELSQKYGDYEYVGKKVDDTVVVDVDVNGEPVQMVLVKDLQTGQYVLDESSVQWYRDSLLGDEEELNKAAERAVQNFNNYAERVFAANQNMTELTEEDQAHLQELYTVRAQLEDAQTYIREHQAEYDEAVKVEQKARNDMYRSYMLLQNLGVDTDGGKEYLDMMNYAMAYGKKQPKEKYAYSDINILDESMRTIEEGNIPNLNIAMGYVRESKEEKDNQIADLQFLLNYFGDSLPKANQDNIKAEIASLEWDSKEYEYFLLQGNEDWKELVAKGEQLNRFKDRNASAYWEYMTKEEKDRYHYLLARDGQDAAAEYYQHLSGNGAGMLSKRMSQDFDEAARLATEENVVLANLIAIGSAPLSSVGSLLGLIYTATTGESASDTPFMLFNNIANNVNEETTREIQEKFKDNPVAQKLVQGAYEIIYNRGRSIMNAAAFPYLGALNEFVGSFPMALTAMADEVMEAKDANMEDWQAWTLGTVALLCEAGTEMIELKDIKAAKELGLDKLSGIKEFLKQYPISGLNEALGESLNDIIENAADRIVLGDEGERAQRVWYYRTTMGMSKEDAEAKAIQDEIYGVLHTAIISYLSPGLDIVSFASGKAALYNHYRREANKYETTIRDIRNKEQTKARYEQQGILAQNDNEDWDNAPNAPTIDIRAAEQEIQIAAQENDYIVDMEILESVKEDPDVNSRSSNMADVLNFGEDDASSDRANAAAVHLENTFENGTEDIEEIFYGGLVGEQNINTLKAGIQYACIGGDNSACRQLVQSDEFRNATPDAKAEMLVQAARSDAQNQTVQRSVESSVYENRIAEQEKRQIANGAMNGTIAAADNAAQAAAATRQARNDLDIKQGEAEAASKANEAAVEAAMQNPTKENCDQANKTAVEVGQRDESVHQYEQHLENVQADQDKANDDLNKVRQKEMSDNRQNAISAVENENQQRAEKSEQDKNADGSRVITGFSNDGNHIYRFGYNVTTDSEHNRNLVHFDQIPGERIQDALKNLDMQAVDREKNTGETRGYIWATRDGTVIDSEQIDNAIHQADEEQKKQMDEAEAAEEQKTYSEQEQTIRDSLAEKGYSGEDLDRQTQRVMDYLEQKNRQKVDTKSQLSDKDGEDFLKQISRKTGITYEMQDLGDPLKTRGYIVDRNHIVLNSNLTKGQALVEAALHEVTHGIEKTNAYESYANFVLNAMYGENAEQYEKDLKTKLKENAALWKKLSDEEKRNRARQELVADYARLNLGKKEFVRGLTAQGLGGKFMDLLNRAISMLKGYSLDAEGRAKYREMRTAMKLLRAAINERAEHVKQSNNGHTGLIQASISGWSDATGLTLEVTDDDNHVYKLSYKGQEIKPGEYKPEMVKGTPIGNMIDMAGRVRLETLQSRLDNGKITREEYNRQAAELEKTAKQQREYVAQIINMISQYQDAAMVWELAGSLAFSSLKTNGDPQYSDSYDFGTICTKTQAILNVISQTQVDLGRALTKEEIDGVVYNEVGRGVQDENGKWIHGATPCPPCYVYATWVNKPARLEKVRLYQNECGNWTNEQINEFMNQPDPVGRTKSETKELKTERNTQKLWISLCLADEVTDPNTGETTWVRKENPTICPNDILLDLRRSGEMATGYAATWTFMQKGGNSQGKAIAPYSDSRLGETIVAKAIGAGEANARLLEDARNEGNEEYIPQFLNPFLSTDADDMAKAEEYFRKAMDKIKAQNLKGGQRWQSWSDFRAEWGSDYLMEMITMQALGSQVQTYTKVVEALDLLASAGFEVNMSLMPYGDGFWHNEDGSIKVDEDGNMMLRFSPVTGINPDSAADYAVKYGKQGNVQPMVVGISDEHIKAALAGDFITFVIPFHGSGGSVQRLQHLMSLLHEQMSTGNDYTKAQSDDFAEYEEVGSGKNKKKINTNPNWALREAILTGNYDNLTEDQKDAIDENPYLKKLYEDRYINEDSEAFGVFFSSGEAHQIYPYEYWDTNTTLATADINSQRFIDYCNLLGVVPRFSGLTKVEGKGKNAHEVEYANFSGAIKDQNGKVIGYADEKGDIRDTNGNVIGHSDTVARAKGYWKLLIDRSMYNRVYDENGKIIPEQCTYHKPQAVSTANINVGAMPKAANNTVGHSDDDTRQITERVIQQLETKNGQNAAAGSAVNLQENANAINNAIYEGTDVQNSSLGDLSETEMDEILRVTDDTYMRAVENGDMETAQETVDLAAKQAGYTLTTYHGTGEIFSIFKRGWEGIHLGNPEQAGQAADTRYEQRSKTTDYRWGKIKESISQLNTEQRESLVKSAYGLTDEISNFKDISPFEGDLSDDNAVMEYVESIVNRYAQEQSELDGFATNPEDINIRMDTFDRPVGRRVMKLYAKINNPFLINGDVNSWTPQNIADVILKRADGIGTKEVYGEQVDITGSDVTLSAEQRSILEDIVNDFGVTDETWDSLSDVLNDLGFDGIQYLNTYEGDRNSYSYIALKQSDIKLADPVTYDNNGEVIKPSERFNQKNDDIRYSQLGDLSDSEIQQLADELQKEQETYPSSAVGLNVYQTNEQRNNIRDYLGSVNQDVKETAIALKENKNIWVSPFALDNVSDREAQDIQNEFGFDVRGYTHMIDRNFFNHVEKRHGENGEHDHTMSDANDIARVGWIIQNYDHLNQIKKGEDDDGIKTSGYKMTGNLPMPIIKYTKQIDGTLYVVEAVGENTKKQLHIMSAYMQNNKPVQEAPDYAASRVADVSSPSLNAQDEHGSPADLMLSQQNPNVNQQNSSLGDLSGNEMDQLLNDLGITNSQDKYARPLEGENPLMSSAVGEAQRQFGQGMLQDSDEVSEKAKAIVLAQNGRGVDTNAEQLDRAIRWIRSQKQTPNSDGLYESMQKIISNNFDYRSADGQARMVALAGIAAAKNDTMAQTVLFDSFDRQGTDLGRALQARKLWKLMTPDGREESLKKMLKNSQEELDAKGVKVNLKFSQWVLDAARAATEDGDMQRVQKAAAVELAQQIPANWRDRFRAWRMLSMLGNFRTHFRNFFGNAMFVPVVSLKNKLGAVAEIATGQKDRTKTLAVRLPKAIRDFSRQDAIAMRDELTGEAKYNEDTAVQRAQKPFKGLLQAVIDFNSGMLEKEDWHFLRNHYRRALGGWMKANGYTADQMRADPSLLEKGRAYAIQEAQKATYRDFNKFAATLNKISREGGVAGFLVDATLPFKKTPANILKRGLEYSPAGLMRSLTTDIYHLKQWHDAQNGKLNAVPDKAISPTQFIDRCCSGLAGSAILAAGALLSSAGIVSCGLDDDDDKYEKEKGRQEYSFKFSILGHDFTYTIDWAAPMSMPFFVGAAIYEQLSSQDGFDVEELVDAFGNITEPVFNLSMLDGINSLFKTSQYDDTNTLTQIGAKVVSNYATSYVPSLLGAIARIYDENARKTFVESGKGTGVLGTFRYAVEQTQNKIPVLNKENIPVRDIWGNAKTSSLAERIIENLISPGYIEEYKEDPILNEMARLYDSTGDIGMIPDADPDKSVTYKKKKYVFTDKQWDLYKETRNRAAYNGLTELINSDEYKNATDDIQVQMIKNVWGYADKVGKQAVIPDYDVENKGINPVATITKEAKVTGYKDEMIKALNDGDYDAYETMVEALHREEVEDSEIKTKIGNTYRDLYKAAYRKNDTVRMAEIEDLLDNTGYNFKIYEWEEQVDMEGEK